MSAKVTSVGRDVILQRYRQELATCIDEMKYKRDVLHAEIMRQDQHKQHLEIELRRLTNSLVQVNESLAHKISTNKRIDDTIIQTEAAFSRLERSSGDLLKFVRKMSDTIP